MKNFTRRGYRIVNANLETKLIYSFFLVFVVIGFVTIAGYQFKIIGWGIDAVRQYYLGNESALQFPQTFLQLLETSHAHSFMMGVIYLTLAHIIIATRLPEASKRVLIIGGFLVTLLDLLLPWGIRYGFANIAPLMLVAWVGEWLFYTSYVVIPLYDMWLKKPELEDM